MLNLQDYGSGGGSIETPVAIADGGTGATTAEDARANLGITSGGVDPQYRRIEAQTNCGATTNSIFGFGTLTATGTAAAHTGGAVGEPGELYTRYTSAATLNAYAKWNTSVAVTKFSQAPTFVGVLAAGASIAVARYWVGMFEAQPTADTLSAATATGVGLRYSTAAGDTTWKAVVNYGGILEDVVVDTGVTVTALQRYVCKIVVDPAVSVKFYINGALVATMDPPEDESFDTSSFVYLQAQTLEAVAKAIYISRFSVAMVEPPAGTII